MSGDSPAFDVRSGPGAGLLLACAALSCTPVALGGEITERGPSGESIGEGDQAIVTSVQDVYDVVAFGADPASGGHDDSDAIQAAIAAAASARGGVIYFPPGEYDVSKSIVLPRSYTRPLTLQGAGRYVSLITTLTDAAGDHLLPSIQPVIDFDASQSLPSRFYAFRDLQISRRNEGPVFRHTRTEPHTRLHEAVFERVIFIAPDDPDGASGTTQSADLVLIQGGLLCTLSDVTFDGGDAGLVIEESSHMSLRDCGTNMDHWSNHGIRLVGGGSHSLYHTRIEALDGGTAIDIEGGETGIANIQIDGLFGEGKRTHTFLRLAGSADHPVKNIVMKDVNIPTPWGPAQGVGTPSYGLYMNDHVRNVRVLGGTIGTWATNLVENGGQPIHIDGGARNIHIRMATDDHVEQDGLGDYVHVAPGATRVHVELIDSLFQPYIRAEGMIDAWTVAGQTAYVGAGPTVRAACSGSITSILQAHTGVEDTPPQEGQRVLLLGTASGAVLVSGTGNLRLSTATFTLCAGAVIQLVYDGTAWQEVSRSVN